MYSHRQHRTHRLHRANLSQYIIILTRSAMYPSPRSLARYLQNYGMFGR